MENDIQEIEIACPACGKGTHRLFMKRGGFSLYRCGACNMFRVFPIPLSTSEVYETDYFSGAQNGHGYLDYDADKEPMRPVFEKYLAHLERYSQEKGELLDVGAATGFFLALAKDRGYSVRGVEISRFAAESAKKKGLDVFAGSMEEASFAKKSFDVVTLCDVLEHFPDPESEIRIVAEMLAPQGLILINTPDAGSLYARILGRKWHLIRSIFITSIARACASSSRSMALLLSR